MYISLSTLFLAILCGWLLSTWHEAGHTVSTSLASQDAQAAKVQRRQQHARQEAERLAQIRAGNARYYATLDASTRG